MIERTSIAKRLTVSVLVLELLAALALIAAVAVNEYLGQSRTLNANLRASANALLGAVQEGPHNEVTLDTRGIVLPRGAAYRVTDENGDVLGSVGASIAFAPQLQMSQSGKVDGRSYRIFALSGERTIDPDKAAVVHHRIMVVVALPEAHIWHEVVEAIQFFAICTLLMLGLTAFLMVIIVRRQLVPIRALADAADGITPMHWHFKAPPSAERIDELRPLAEAIRRTVARLELSFEQQKRFTNDAAHELKTDLAIIKSSMQLLAMRQRSAAEYEQGLNVSLGDLSRLEATVQQMLVLARLEQAAAERTQVCRIDEILRSVLKQVEPLAHMSSVRLETPQLNAATVALDSRDATLLCSNILMNALQHTPEHGFIEVASHASAQEVRITVRDSGEGVLSAETHLLFEPFYRADASRSRKTGGTGLGLSICKAICDKAGGSISIGNAEGSGAIVALQLPIVARREKDTFSKP